jgi:hypothetical protein
MKLKSGNLVVVTFFLIFIASFFSIIKPVSAVGEVTVCAEKTTSGLWCQNVPANQASTAINPVTGKAYEKAQTSCESTSFCRMGTCVDNKQGECRPGVPKTLCQQSDGGVWHLEKPEDLQQCQLGCCLIGEQASFVTSAGCTALSSQYGKDANFNSQIKDFDECTALSNPREMGACVIDDGFQRDCKNIANSECAALRASVSGANKTVKFEPGLLCTAGVLATRCAVPAPGKVKTTCVEGKFGVYFLDTCGNVANIYDASKVSDKEYWTKIKEASDSTTCGSSSVTGSAGSTACGNCDYQAGSVCKPYQRGSEQTPSPPKYGDYLCADLSCTYQGQTYKHGEEWCASNSPGIDKSLPGSEYYKLTCYNGEVAQTQCDSFRQSVCVDGESNEGFKTAACIVNMWRDCVNQTSEKSCENTDERDCKWVVGDTLKIHVDDKGGALGVDKDGNLVQNTKGGNVTEKGAACLPKYTPGFLFWNPQNVTTEQKSLSQEMETACAVASEDCIVKFQRINRFDKWHCAENCECVTESWVKSKATQCLALGDCGVKTNYIEKSGESYDSVAVFGSPEKNFPGYSQEQIDKLEKVGWK